MTQDTEPRASAPLPDRRTGAPPRRRTRVLAVVIALVCGGGLYWLGYSRAERAFGFAMAENQTLRASLREREGELETLSQQLVNLRTGAEIDRDAEARVRSEVAAERARVARLELEVALFRSLMDSSVRTSGLALYGFEAESGRREGSYHYRLTFMQRADKYVELRGFATLDVVGLSGGKERILPLAKLSAEPPRGRHPLRFLYFQVLEGDLELPEGFEPAKVRVRAEARGRKLYTVDRVVEWRLKEA
jgi:hypothetical protein